jgi:hypothetical protein
MYEVLLFWYFIRRIHNGGPEHSVTDYLHRTGNFTCAKHDVNPAEFGSNRIFANDALRPSHRAEKCGRQLFCLLRRISSPHLRYLTQQKEDIKKFRWM